jgi:hypothetical protein
MGKWIRSKGYKYKTTAPYILAQNVMASPSMTRRPLAMKFETLGWTWPVIYLNVIVHAFRILMTWGRRIWIEGMTGILRFGVILSPVLLNDFWKLMKTEHPTTLDAVHCCNSWRIGRQSCELIVGQYEFAVA